MFHGQAWKWPSQLSSASASTQSPNPTQVRTAAENAVFLIPQEESITPVVKGRLKNQTDPWIIPDITN